MKAKVNDVIQINEKMNGCTADLWIGCLMIVEEVKEWGVVAGTKVPGMGNTYLRVEHGQYDVIGPAALVPESEEE